MADSPDVEPSPHTSSDALLDALPEPCAIVDRSLRALRTNRAWRAKDDLVELGDDLAGWEVLTNSHHDLHAALDELHSGQAGALGPFELGRSGRTVEFRTLEPGALLVRIGDARAAYATRERERVRALEIELEQLHTAYAIAGIGFWRVDAGKDEIWWSDETFRIHGRDVGDLPTLEQAIEHYAPHERPVIEEAVRRGIEEGEEWDLELQFDRADGQRIWVRALGRADVREGQTVIYGAFVDIDEQKQRELEAHAKDQQLNLVLAGSHDGHWDWDIQTDAVWYSPRYKELLGYGEDELQASIETFSDLLHPEDSDAVFAAVQLHLEQRIPYESEHRLLCKDGSYRWFRARGQAQWDDDGKPLRMSGATTDITTQVVALRALEDARRSAVEASLAKSDFLANMSHEIRTPMAAILGFTDLLLDNSLSEADRGEFVQTIRRNGEHLLELINDILDLSKIEAGELRVETIGVSIVEEVDAVVELMRVRAEEKGITLDVELPDDLPEQIQSDPLRLRQILTNLVGNAIKFTERGGVALRAVVDRERNEIRMSVEDSGIGISPEQQLRLFDAFSQADTSTTRKFGGSGLGLAISQRLAEVLGGDIGVESEMGRGSTFTLTLSVPAEQLERRGRLDQVPGPLPKDRRPTDASRPLEGLRLLLAEDGADNRKLISIHLKRAGAELSMVENGRLAVEWVERAEVSGDLPDLVLMDMQMPEMDGYAATAELRSRGLEFPIVAITAHAMQGDEDRCREAGCDGYLTKPVDAKRMVQLIRDRVRQRRARS